MIALVALFALTSTIFVPGPAAGYRPVSESSVPEAADASASSAVWSSALTVGVNESTVPPEAGYSLALDGALSVDTFTLDGSEHRVVLLVAAAGGFYFGVSEALQTDFALRVGDRLFESAASSAVTLPLAADSYWWGDSDLGWSGGETVEVSLTPTRGPRAGSAERPMAPLGAYFRLVPEYHNGVDAFTFRVHFTNGAPTVSYKTMRDHAFDVGGGTVRAARRVIRGSNRIWSITVVPGDEDAVSVALIAGRACDSVGAVCASDGRRLHNRPHVVVAGPPPTEPPPAPANLRATAYTDGSVILSWDAPDDDSITGYQIMRRHPGDSEGTTVETLLDTGSTETTYTDSDLVPDVLHAYYVKAVNAAGASERSNYDNATPFEGEEWEFGFHLPIVHLTFDDGPKPPHTAQVLDVLEKYGARATFFVTGLNAALHPELIARMVAEGHAVGNHAWQHERLTLLSREQFDSTVTRTQDQIGARAVACLRPPYGETDLDTDSWASSLGLRVVKWTVDSRDWTGSTADKLVSRLSSAVTYFSVVLMHDTGEQTVEALETLLARWAGQGYEFKPVCEPSTASVKTPNAPATGSPTISGLARVGETLTSDVSPITDGDGIDSVHLSYRWLADNAEIAGAADSTYRVTAEHEGKSITVRVSFTDNAGNQESLTSVPTAPAAEAEPVSGSPDSPRNLTVAATDSEGQLVVSWDPPGNDNGSEVTGYTVEWRLSAGYWGDPGVTQAQTAETSHTITGLVHGSRFAVRVRALNQTGAGEASGEALAAPSGPAPLLAEFQGVPPSHAGGSFVVRIAFSEAIANGYISVRDRALEVTGGMVLSASRVDRRGDLWDIQVLPSGTDHVTVVLPAAADCSVWGDICTSDRKKLSNRLQLTVPGH